MIGPVWWLEREKIENYFSIQCSINVVLKWLSCCFQFCYINAIYHNVSMSTSAFFGTFFLYFSFFASLTFLSTMAFPSMMLQSISTCVLKMLLYCKVYRYFHNLLNIFTSSVWGGFSNSWCFSSTLKGVSFFGSSMGFLCTGFLGFNFKPAKGGGGGSSSFPLEACVSACCVCNFWGIKISYEYL